MNEEICIALSFLLFGLFSSNCIALYSFQYIFLFVFFFLSTM
jgi:hypothetical protein